MFWAKKLLHRVGNLSDRIKGEVLRIIGVEWNRDFIFFLERENDLQLFRVGLALRNS